MENENTNGGTQGGTPQPLSFDEILEDKVYQSEFDKRVSKALNTAKEKWTEEQKTATQNAVNKAVEDATGPLNAEIKNLKIRAEIVKEQARDAEDIINLVNLDSVTIEDGKVIGLSEQIKTLKEKKPYLFIEEPSKEKPSQKSGLDHSEKADDGLEMAKIRQAMGLPPLKK